MVGGPPCPARCNVWCIPLTKPDPQPHLRSKQAGKLQPATLTSIQPILFTALEHGVVSISMCRGGPCHGFDIPAQTTSWSAAPIHLAFLLQPLPLAEADQHWLAIRGSLQSTIHYQVHPTLGTARIRRPNSHPRVLQLLGNLSSKRA